VEDVKLGARTSTIHIKLLQESDKKPGKMETMVAGYITVSPPDAEVGISAVTGWKPYPSPDLSVLGRTGRDGSWMKLNPPFAEFRKAAAQIELFGPVEKRAGMDVDQWARFRPGGDVNGRWTNAAVAYLIDMFPMALDGFDHMSAEAVARENGSPVGEMKAKFWYPTVTLNVDMKKHLPAEVWSGFIVGLLLRLLGMVGRTWRLLFLMLMGRLLR
jgi:hypothetical protein